MATVFTEGRPPAGFILDEANGERSREASTVKSGETLLAGEVIALDGAGKIISWNGGTGTAAAGIIIYPCDATGGDVPAKAYIARDCEVNVHLLTYPPGTLAAVTAALEANGIIVR